MRKGLRQAMIVLGICMCLGGCEKETEAKQSRKERRYRAKTEIFSGIIFRGNREGEI